MKPRNFQYIADEIIKIIQEDCTFDEARIGNIIEQLEKIKNDNLYKAPELQYVSWDDLSSVLSSNFVPSNSKWETELMVIFCDLSGDIEDYWDDGNNELRRCESERQ